MKTIIFTTALLAWSGLCVRAGESLAVNTNSMPVNALTDYAGKFGIGAMVGEPTGASLKYWLNDTVAIDGAVGWSFHEDSNLYLHSEVLWHNFDLLPVSHGRLPVYFGVGALARFRDQNHDNEVGIRVPVGLCYLFENAPVDVFVEVAPAIDVAPGVRGEITGGVGVRYWFK